MKSGILKPESGLWIAMVARDVTTITKTYTQKTMAVHITARSHLIDLRSARAVSLHARHDAVSRSKKGNVRPRLTMSGDAGRMVSDDSSAVVVTTVISILSLPILCGAVAVVTSRPSSTCSSRQIESTKT